MSLIRHSAIFPSTGGGGGGGGANTENKRRSALMDPMIGLDLRPSGVINQPARQAAVWIYSGILASQPTGGGIKIMPEQLGLSALIDLI